MGIFFWRKKDKKPAEKAAKPENKAKTAAENAIRDIINWIEVTNMEEIQGATKKIEDSAAKQLNNKLRSLAKKVGKI